jgi:hypothetical protein
MPPSKPLPSLFHPRSPARAPSFPTGDMLSFRFPQSHSVPRSPASPYVFPVSLSSSRARSPASPLSAHATSSSDPIAVVPIVLSPSAPRLDFSSHNWSSLFASLLIDTPRCIVIEPASAGRSSFFASIYEDLEVEMITLSLALVPCSEAEGVPPSLNEVQVRVGTSLRDVVRACCEQSLPVGAAF